MQALTPTPESSALHARSMVTRADELYQARRGDKVLIVEPLTASWGVFSQKAWSLLAQASRPTSVAELIERTGAQGLESGKAADLLSQMYRQGFIHIDGRPFRDPQSMWERPDELPSFISIHVAEGCNLRCSYCYADAGANLNLMPRDLLFKVIEKAVREIPNDSLTIDFLGGEPFLLYDEILEAIAHGNEIAEPLGKRIDWIMQTNATMLSRKRARQLRDLNVGVGVSIDGPRHLHDRYRRRAGGGGSWSAVFRNLMSARDEGLRVAPLAVIHEPSTCSEVLTFFVERAFDYVRLNYTSPLGRAREGLEFPPDRAEAFARAFMDMVGWAHQWCDSHKQRLRIGPLNQMLQILVTKNRDYMCMRSPCGLGDTTISFGPGGEIYACEEFEATTRATFLLGQTSEKTIPEVLASSHNYHLLKQRRVEKIPRCSRCHLRYTCGGGCTHKSLAYYGTPLREDPMCRYFQIVFEELMWMISADKRVVENLGAV